MQKNHVWFSLIIRMYLYRLFINDIPFFFVNYKNSSVLFFFCIFYKVTVLFKYIHAYNKLLIIKISFNKYQFKNKFK